MPNFADQDMNTMKVLSKVEFLQIRKYNFFRAICLPALTSMLLTF